MNDGIKNMLNDDAITHQIALGLAAETALRDSEERWRFALKGAGDGVWDWDVLTDIVFLTPLCREIIGFEEDEFGSNRG